MSEDVQIFGTAYDMTDREVHGKKDRIAQSIGWKIRDYTGPASEVIDLANKWESTNDEKISLIKEFFRKHENADLV
ncbi:MAG: hypothetical protein GY928_10305 [Colwellia sp.]|nr:hypothetical protein [Colwellia sp.]